MMWKEKTNLNDNWHWLWAGLEDWDGDPVFLLGCPKEQKPVIILRNCRTDEIHYVLSINEGKKLADDGLEDHLIER